MFSDSKRRFTAIIMFIFVFILCFTLAIIYFSTYSRIIKEDKDMLSNFAYYYEQNGLPESSSAKNDNAGFANDKELTGGFQTSTFYAVVYDKSGNVTESLNDRPMQYPDDELKDRAYDFLLSGKEFALSDTIAFYVTYSEDYTLVTMMDVTAVSAAISSLFRYMIFFGIVAIIILFVASTLLYGWVIKPLEKGYSMQKQFISDAGHELKTPISTINANAEILKRDMGENNWLDNIIFENNRMSVIVHQLLDLTRLESLRPVMQKTDLSRLVLACVLPFEAAAFEKNINLNYTVKKDIFFNADASYMEKLVSVLVDNAISHSPAGSAIEIELEEKQGKIYFSTSNASEEIDSDELINIFERFYRSDKSRSFASHYGLGLSIAKSIAVSHGGDISASYQNGRITFTVTL